MSPCSILFYYCIHYTAYLIQNSPVGLVCYDNTFVLASNPTCRGFQSVQEFPIYLDTSNASAIWSVLYEYRVASAVASAFSKTPTNITVSDIYLSSRGRRLSAAEQTLGIRSSDPNLSKSLVVAVANLPQILFTNHLGVTITLMSPSLSSSSSLSPSPSPSLTPTPPYPSSFYPSPSPSPISFPIPTVSGASRYVVSPIVSMILFLSLFLSLSLSLSLSVQ